MDKEEDVCANYHNHNEHEHNEHNHDHEHNGHDHICVDENGECAAHDVTKNGKNGKNAKKQLLLKNIKNMFAFFAACFAACLFGCGCFLCFVVVINLILLQIIACAGAYRIVCWTVS